MMRGYISKLKRSPKLIIVTIICSPLILTLAVGWGIFWLLGTALSPLLDNDVD